MKRSTSLRRLAPLRNKRRTPRRSARVRDLARLSAIHDLPCAARHLPGHVCAGAIEADHVGRRPMGRKSDDAATIALCRLGHRQRTDHCGPFRHMTQAERRAFEAGALAEADRLLQGRMAHGEL